MSTHTHRAGSQEWDDDTLTDLKAARDEPVTEVIAYPLSQSAWDARQVHQLRQVEHVLAYFEANKNRPDDVLIKRGAVILLAEPSADDAERLLGVRTDVPGTAAYLAEPLPEGAQPKALPAAKPKTPRKRTTTPRKRTPKAAQPPAKGDGDGLA